MSYTSGKATKAKHSSVRNASADESEPGKRKTRPPKPGSKQDQAGKRARRQAQQAASAKSAGGAVKTTPSPANDDVKKTSKAQRKAGHLNPTAPREEDRRRIEEKMKVEAEEDRGSYYFEGRKLTREAKEKKKIRTPPPPSPFMFNTYAIRPLHTGRDGRAAWGLRFKGPRAVAPPPPENLNPDYRHRIENMMTGEGHPLSVPNSREGRATQTPCLDFLVANCITAAVSFLAAQADRMSSFTLHVVGSSPYLRVIAGALMKLKRAYGWERAAIEHYGAERIITKFEDVDFSSRTVAVEDEHLVLGGVPVAASQCPPIALTVVSCFEGSATYDFFHHAVKTQALEVTLAKPHAAFGSFGSPTAELVWRAERYEEEDEGQRWYRTCVVESGDRLFSVADLRAARHSQGLSRQAGFILGDGDNSVLLEVSLVSTTGRWLDWRGTRWEKVEDPPAELSKAEGKEPEDAPAVSNSAVAQIRGDTRAEEFVEVPGAPSTSDPSNEPTEGDSLLKIISDLVNQAASGSVAADPHSEQETPSSSSEMDSSIEAQEVEARADLLPRALSEAYPFGDTAPDAPATSDSETSLQPTSTPERPASPVYGGLRWPSVDDESDLVESSRKGRVTTSDGRGSTISRINRGGMLDPVHPVNPNAQRSDGVTMPTPFVQDRGGWYFTRRFYNWLLNSGWQVQGTASFLSGAALSTIGWYAFRNIRMVRAMAVVGACSMAGHFLWPRFVRTRDEIEADGVPQAPLDVRQQATLENVVGSFYHIKRQKGERLNGDEAVRLATTASSAMAGASNAIALIPNVVATWDSLDTMSGLRRNKWAGAAVGALTGFGALAVHSALVRSGLAQIIPAVARAVGSVLHGLGDSVSNTLQTVDYTFFELFTPWRAPSQQRLEHLREVTGKVLATTTDTNAREGILRMTRSWGLVDAMIMVGIGCIAPLVEESIKGVAAWGYGQITGDERTGLWIAGISYATFELWGYCMAYPPQDQNFGFLMRLAPWFMHTLISPFTWRQRVTLHFAYNFYLFYVTHLHMIQAMATAPFLTLHRARALPLGYVNPPICVRHQKRAEVRPGAMLVVRPDRVPVDCRPGQGFHLAGPYVSSHTVFCFRSCMHNMLAAATSRMAGVPKVFQGIGDHSTYLATEARVDAHILATFPSSYEPISRAFAPIARPTLTHSEWCDRFPRHKSDALFSSWTERSLYPVLDYDSFVKKEKSVATETEQAWFALAPDGVVPPCPLKLDPRGISVPEEEVRVVTGPWCHWLNASMHEGFMAHIHYVPGDTPLTLSVWLERAIAAVSGGHWPYAVAVQGDDSLILILVEGVLMYLSSDFSRYDMSQRVAHFRCTWDLIERMGLSCPDPVRNIIQCQQGIIGRGRVYHLGAGYLRIRGTMASGDGVTITFNSLILIQAVVSFLESRAGLSGFSDHMARLGFAVTYATGRLYDAPLAMDFLQSRFWLCSDGSRRLGPKPGRILSRFFWIPKKFNSERKYRRAASEMAFGLLFVAAHVPLINDICLRVLELEPVTRSYWALEGPAELRSWRTGDGIGEHPDSLYEMAMFYNVPITSLLELRSRCRVWNFGEAIDDNDHLTQIVATIAAIDLQ